MDNIESFFASTFKQFLTERFVNAVGNEQKSMDVKNEYVDQVWDLLQKSYASIGGIKGSGFTSKQDMIDNIPMWKMIIDNKVVRGVVLYKDKGGRKSVAMGSDGSEYAKKNIVSLVSSDIKRSYGEKSKAALGMVLKTIPWNILKDYIKTPQEAAKILGEKTMPISGSKMALPDDAKTTLAKYPELIDYGYLREIGGHMMFKVMIGSTGNTIR